MKMIIALPFLFAASIANASNVTVNINAPDGADLSFVAASIDGGWPVTLPASVSFFDATGAAIATATVN